MKTLKISEFNRICKQVQETGEPVVLTDTAIEPLPGDERPDGNNCLVHRFDGTIVIEPTPDWITLDSD